MGHIQRRSDRPGWRARYIAPDGRERSKTFRRKIDAERFLATVEVEKLRGEWADPRLGKVTFGEWAEEWRQTNVYRKEKTRAGHESLLRVHLLPAFGAYPLAKITPMQIRAWVAEASKSMSASRVRGAYFLLSKVLRTAVQAGYLARTPCVGIELPIARTREMLFLNAAEVRALADAVDARFRTFVLLLAYGGLRWGEVCALRRKRVDVARSRIEVAESLWEVGHRWGFGEPKTYHVRTVVIPAFLRDLMGERLEQIPSEPDALVFTEADGQPLRNSRFHRRVWGPAVRTAGLHEGLRIHDLRHTCAALLIAHRAGPKEIQAQLGHASITMTFDRYGHLFPENLERLAEALDATYRNSARPGDGPECADSSTKPPSKQSEDH
jgi:integrase